MWFFGRAGAVPTAATQGVRSLFAFWMGGATATVLVPTATQTDRIVIIAAEIRSRLISSESRVLNIVAE